MKNAIFAFLVIAIVGLGSCASSYQAIQPAAVNYQTTNTNKSVDFSYKYDVLGERGNKKYRKRESRKGIKIVAVRVINNSEKAFTFGEDLSVHRNNAPVEILEPAYVHRELKQGVPIYLLYMLLTPMQLYTGEDSYPIGVIIGPGITAGNMITAGTANGRLLRELQSNFLNGRVIQPGETAYGLIGIRDQGYSPLSLQ